MNTIAIWPDVEPVNSENTNQHQVIFDKNSDSLLFVEHTSHEQHLLFLKQGLKRKIKSYNYNLTIKKATLVQYAGRIIY